MAESKVKSYTHHMAKSKETANYIPSMAVGAEGVNIFKQQYNVLYPFWLKASFYHLYINEPI